MFISSRDKCLVVVLSSLLCAAGFLELTLGAPTKPPPTPAPSPVATTVKDKCAYQRELNNLVKLADELDPLMHTRLVSDQEASATIGTNFIAKVCLCCAALRVH